VGVGGEVVVVLGGLLEGGGLGVAVVVGFGLGGMVESGAGMGGCSSERDDG
jgi:hypothetical protein